MDAASANAGSCLELHAFPLPALCGIHVPYQRINEVINGRRGITPSTALRLSKFFGVSADFWMNLQLRWDLYFAQESETKDLKLIKPISPHKIPFNESSAQPSAGQ